MQFFMKLSLGVAALLVLVLSGALLLLRRDDVPYAALEAKYAKVESEFVNLSGGVRAHYRDQGRADGRTLVLIHGFGVSLETWEPWVRHLADRYRLVSIDLPGHGLTRAPENYAPSIRGFADFVNDFAVAKGLENYTLIGNSMGGHTAWVLALRHPQRLDALVLIDAGGWPNLPPPQQRPLAFRLLANPRIAPLLATLDPKPVMQNGLRAAFANKALATDALASRYADMASAPGHRQILGAIGARRGRTDIDATLQRLAAIAIPTLILWGEMDELIPVAHAQKFKDAIKGSRAIIYPGIGHLPYEELAEKTAMDLGNFLDASDVSTE